MKVDEGKFCLTLRFLYMSIGIFDASIWLLIIVVLKLKTCWERERDCILVAFLFISLYFARWISFSKQRGKPSAPFKTDSTCIYVLYVFISQKGRDIFPLPFFFSFSHSAALHFELQSFFHISFYIFITDFHFLLQ